MLVVTSRHLSGHRRHKYHISFLCVFLTVTSFLLRDTQNLNFDVIRKSRMINRNVVLEVIILKMNESVTLIDSIVLGIWA
jgi:hypothetical protein